MGELYGFQEKNTDIILNATSYSKEFVKQNNESI